MESISCVSSKSQTMDIRTTLIWITLILVYFVGLSASKNSCELDAYNCDYEIQVFPKDGALENPVKQYTSSRIKRATFTNSENVTKMIETVSEKVEKLQKKMIKEMRNLSTRVLRGVRRLDSVVTDLISKQTKSGLRNPHVCPPGFVSLDNWRSCYMFSKFNATWFEARDYCNALDSEMVSLTTLKEHHLVSYLIKNNDERRKTEAWWTSGQYVSKIKAWMWTSDSELRPFTFIKWAVGEPNQSSLQCVILFSGDDLFWHDQLCTEKYNFVCEFETVT